LLIPGRVDGRALEEVKAPREKAEKDAITKGGKWGRSPASPEGPPALPIAVGDSGRFRKAEKGSSGKRKGKRKGHPIGGERQASPEGG